MEQKSKMPQIGEAVFCIIYLMFGFIAGIALLVNADGAQLKILFGIITLVLAGGDSFHLVPRIINAFKEKFAKYEFWAGLGLLVSSVTMTIFYVLLYYALEILAVADNRGMDVVGNMFYILLLFSIVRIALCLFPQNNWFHKEGNPKWGIIRNIPFIIVGIIAVHGCFIVGQVGMAIAIIISFACYLLVVFWAKQKPVIGMLMMPKTIAYMWMICIMLSI